MGLLAAGWDTKAKMVRVPMAVPVVPAAMESLLSQQG